MSVDRVKLRQQLSHVLEHTEYSFLGDRYEGKVRDCYRADNIRYLITTDRLSCFDVVVSSIPFKGQILNELAVSWFQEVEDIIPNHLIAVPDPNVMVARECEIVPVEVVIRGYLTGSGWRDYEQGRPISGIVLPPGLQHGEKLPEPIITPSTKAARGDHDLPISEAEIVSTGLVSQELWTHIRETALALFARGQECADQRGLLLVDTKYEFGIVDGDLVLADEIHTLDSSRYWIKQSYQERFEGGMLPEMLDKEPMRQWLIAQGFQGEGFQGEGDLPSFSDQYRMEIAEHYIHSYEQILGRSFTPQWGDATPRIEQALRRYQEEKDE